MANEFRDAARAALAAIAADSATSDSAVSVLYDGASTTGVRGVNVEAAAMDIIGELGVEAMLVRVPANGISKPEKGGTIVVDGERVTVTNIRTDPVGAMYVIEYTVQQVRD